MVTEKASAGHNDSWFDILDQLMYEVNQSHLEEVQWDSDKAQIVKVCFTKTRFKFFGGHLFPVCVGGSANDFHWMLWRGLQSNLNRSIFQTEMSQNIPQVVPLVPNTI